MSPLTIRGRMHPRFDEILTPDALGFLAELDLLVAGHRAELLAARVERQRRLDAGAPLDFRADTARIRADPNWRVAPIAPGLADRRCEITGPPTRKMTVNALNSGASVWMADFEDSTAPTWFNIVDGQLNLFDALRGEIDFVDEAGRSYAVRERTPTIMVRPRGWRLDEAHLVAEGRSLSGSIVDFGLYAFHNAQLLVERGVGPYFYLAKLESHEEARLWNAVFSYTEARLALATGTIRATVLVETFPAAFEMEEILYELREHSAGLNAGRWDYIFSFIKTFAARGPGYVLPDRQLVTMTSPMMRAYARQLVDVCRRRGAQPIGGMAAYVPQRGDDAATERALIKVEEDKTREAEDGFVGSWVAHPALVRTCRQAFQSTAPSHEHFTPVSAADLIGRPTELGAVSIAGVRTNIGVALRYLAAWVGGAGAVAIDSLMEDAATVEISRAQIWQWLKHRIRTSDGLVVSPSLVNELLDDAIADLRRRAVDARDLEQIELARAIFVHAALGEQLPDFFTPYGYQLALVELTGDQRLAGAATG